MRRPAVFLSFENGGGCLMLELDAVSVDRELCRITGLLWWVVSILCFAVQVVRLWAKQQRSKSRRQRAATGVARFAQQWPAIGSCISQPVAHLTYFTSSPMG
jgi:hypothetical protein